MKAIHSVVLLLALEVALFGCVSEQRRPKTGQIRTYYHVSEVISGDTIFVNGVGKMRYIGVSAPKQGSTDRRDQLYSLLSKRENERLLSGKWCRFELDEKQAERGTTLAYVFVRTDGEEIFINEHLLEQGLARFSPSTLNTRYYERLLRAEDRAKQERRGMWAQVPTQ